MKRILLALLLLLVATNASAAPILIINGSVGTSEPLTTAAITANLTQSLQDAGHTVTVSSGIPGSFAGYAQVWDIRFDNVFALSAAERSQYIAYLAGGGGMFVMGENSFFPTRNASVLALIAEAGGGNLTFTTPPSTQTVQPPFDVPFVLNSITYGAPGGVTSPGTGAFATSNGGVGTAIAWGIGDLANAPAGALTVVFDVNFMDWTVNPPNSERFTRNLVSFLDAEVGPEVPEPTSLAIWGLVGATGLWFQRRRKLQATA